MNLHEGREETSISACGAQRKLPTFPLTIASPSATNTQVTPSLFMVPLSLPPITIPKSKDAQFGSVPTPTIQVVNTLLLSYLSSVPTGRPSSKAWASNFPISRNSLNKPIGPPPLQPDLALPPGVSHRIRSLLTLFDSYEEIVGRRPVFVLEKLVSEVKRQGMCVKRDGGQGFLFARSGERVKVLRGPNPTPGDGEVL